MYKQATPRVLVIDDDVSLLRVIRLSLRYEGFDVQTARDGLEGLEKVEAGDFDLVLLDLQMPRMDGRAFYRELRSRGHEVPVVILSAYGAQEALADLQAQGAVGKPFDPSVLVSSIRRVLSPAAGDGVGL